MEVEDEDEVTVEDEDKDEDVGGSSSSSSSSRCEAKESSRIPVSPARLRAEPAIPTPGAVLAGSSFSKGASKSTPVRELDRSPPPHSLPLPAAPSENAVASQPARLETTPPPLPVKPKTATTITVQEKEEVVDPVDTAATKPTTTIMEEPKEAVGPAEGETTSFASFPSAPEKPAFGEPSLFAEDGGEPSTPAMPRHPPPRVPSWEGDGERDVTRGETSSGDDGGSGAADNGENVVDDKAADTGASEDVEDWGTGDPFDDFQSAPAAAASRPPSPSTETPAWNLDFFMSAAPSKGADAGVGVGGLLPAQGLVGGVTGERDAGSGNSMDLVR